MHTSFLEREQKIKDERNAEENRRKEEEKLERQAHADARSDTIVK
jgi:hypothetical protein